MSQVAGAAESTCVLKMGYRTNERLPNIARAPDNSGLYMDLYQKAAQEVGCELRVIRLPKNKVVSLLKRGDIDFYPGFNLTKKRAAFVYFIESGLPGGDIGVSREDMAEVTQLEQLKGKVLLRSKGAPDITRGITDIYIKQPPEMTSMQAMTFLLNKKGDFYIYNKSTLEYLLKQHQLNGLKLHPNCCGGVLPLYLGFSLKSKWFQGTTNPKYKKNQPISVDNYPTLISSESKAHEFAQALKRMKLSGETQALYDHYYN
ncbi:transporter substrate-binding domain-containing protein [Vibrio sp. S9_S30]|nr:transporter substrate-binding domain-containing protein [Vibrio sp. S9_S30]